MSDAPLRTSSQVQHVSILNVLEKKGHIERNETGIILNPTLLDYLKSIPNINTRKNYFSALIRAASNYPADILKPFIEEQKKVYAILRPLKKKQNLPDHRKEQMLSWEEVKKLEPKAKADLNLEEYLIYCLYTMNEPVRADYWDMPVVSRINKTIMEDKTRNYCVVQARMAYFIFNEYKTADRYGRRVIKASPELFAVLKEHAKVGENLLSCKDSVAMGHKVTAVFMKLSGKRMGIGLLRHSRIIDFLKIKRSIKQKEELAFKMLQSTLEQERYDIIEDS